MKRLILALCLLLPGAVWAQNCIPSGVSDQYTYFVAVDSTDLVTRETGLSSFTVYRSRNGGAATAFTTPTINETSNSNMPGVYELLLDEDMTIDSGDDVQHMALHITHAGMAPVTKEICIARAKVTAGETLTVSSGSGNAAVQSVASGAITASAIADNAIDMATFATDTNPLFGIMRRGTAQSATSTTLVLDSGASFADDTPIGGTLIVCGSTQGYCQSRLITDYVGSTDTATVDTWAVTPSGTLTYYYIGSAPSSGGGSGATAQEVWEYSTRTLTALDEDTTTIDLNATAVGSVAGNVTGSVGSIATGGISSSSFASGAIDATAIAANAIGASEIADNAIDAGAIASDAITAAKIAANAIDAATFAADVDAEILSYLVDDATRIDASALNTASTRVATALPNAAPAGNGGLPTVNASNYIAGMAGTINTLDALDTAQDSQHSTTQGLVTTVDGVVDAIKVETDKLADTLEDQGGGTYGFTEAALQEAPTGEGGGGTDWDVDERTAIRSILGIPASGTTPDDPSVGILDTIRDSVATRASQTSVDDLPTNSELASALGSADDATLSAISGLNNLSSAQAQSAAAAALASYDPPTRAELTSDVNSILAALLDASDIRDIVIEDQGGGVTLGCALAIALAYAAGDVSTTGQSSTYKDPSGGETRIAGTVSSNGNRAVTATCPSY